jgi:hypothetical protein
MEREKKEKESRILKGLEIKPRYSQQYVLKDLILAKPCVRIKQN